MLDLLVSLQLEGGLVNMSSAPDDFWYENALKHDTDFATAAFGAGLRFESHNVQLSVGWRNLGNEHQSSDIIADAHYFACRAKPSTCEKPVQYWTETGNTQQTYAELGYAFHLGSFRLVPSVGIAETRFTSHENFYAYQEDGSLKRIPAACSAGPQMLPRPFVGLTLQRGNLGIGAYQLNTEPNRGANNCSSPFQGSSATYLRVTSALPL